MMNLPKLQKPERYQGLYVCDFGTQSGVGFTADEVAELLESEQFRDTKVYKIHRAYPDGRMELKGVPGQRFQLESGLFFYADDEDTARDDYGRLLHLAVAHQPPCRAKVQLARWSEDQYVVGLIYPSEHDEEVSAWLLTGQYRVKGLTEGGYSAVQQYYERGPEILERHQLYGESRFESRTGEALLTGLKRAVQR